MKNYSIKAIGLLTLAITIAACGQTPTKSVPVTTTQSIPASMAIQPNGYFVELDGEPSSNLTAQAIQTQQANFRQLARSQGIQYTETRSYSTLFNGFAVKAAGTEIAKISQLPGVVAVYPIEIIAMPQTQLSNPDMASAVGMTGADYAQNELGLTGKGVKVAVMDTGIDLDHPAFANRIVAQYDFVGDAFNAQDAKPIIQPDPLADDCATAGHGTHVAGIVGGNDPATGFKGVAPAVSFGAYRVFGCEGSTTADIMLQAMERAYQDGMDVLNMSIGASYQWPQYPTARAASRLVKYGMVVTVSAGNSGANGQFATGAPSLGENVISVASVDNVQVELPYFTASSDNKAMGYNVTSGSTAATPTSGALELAKTGTTTTADDACAALPANSLTGKAALIRRGGCTFYTKAKNAQDAGAAAVILYNNTTGRLSPTVSGDPAIAIPVVMITAADGADLDARITAGVATLTWAAGLKPFANATGNLLSSFSSYGTSPDLEFKPDVAAPGGLIKSAYPLDNTESPAYAVLSGTSMAAPHAAGAAALLLEANPAIQAKEMRAIMQNTARPLKWSGNPGLGFLDYVQRQGAGMIDIVAAYENKTMVTPSKLTLGESAARSSVTKVVVIRNHGAQPQVFDVSHTPALTIAGTTFTPKASDAFANVTFSSSKISVPANGEAEVSVTITAPAAPLKGQYGGYITFINKSGGRDTTVPYGGFIGDYQSIKVLAPTELNFPWLAKLDNGSYKPQVEAGATYSLQNGDLPELLVHFAHQSRRVQLQVVSETGETLGSLYGLEYFGRSPTEKIEPGVVETFVWDGTLQGQELPDGKYRLQVKVLKALGDENKPEHTETWSSPLFTIDRP